MTISRRVLAATILFLGATGLAAPSLAADCEGQRPWINEFDYDDVSAGGVQDTDEFVEIAAPAGTDLSGYRIMAIEGNADFGACTTGIGGSNGNPYFIGTIPAGSVVGDDTGTGIGFYVVCFTNTSGDIGAECDVTVTGVATDSNLKNGHLLNADPTLCPDGVLLLDAQGGLADAISWEGIIPDEGFYGRMFNAPNPSYNAGRDIGFTEAESFEKTTGVGRAMDSWEWSLSGLDSHSPGAINAGQELLCDPPPPEPVDCTVEGPWINEFDYDDNSAGGVQDTDEFVEIAAPAGTDISGYQVLAIEGNQNIIGCGTGQWWIPNGTPYFTGVVPGGSVVADDTGTGIGFYVVCFTYTSGDIGAECDVTVTGIAADSNLKNGNLYNSHPTNCPDGVLLLDPQDALTDAISWEGVIPNVGTYGHMFNAPNPSYNIGRDTGYTEQESFEKTTGIGRAVEAWEWTFSGANSNSPGGANPGQFLVCAPEDICGDSVLTENEDCDDGNTDDGDCCSSTCQFEIVGTECSDGDVCNGLETCDGAGSCNDGTALACDDADACNGAETCDAALGCQDGTPPVCDDGDVCNGVETCDAALGCQTGTPLACDDSNACNGAETCDAVLGCQAGTPPVCSDGNVCNGFDYCHSILGCQTTPPLNCDDADVCNGSETCDPVLGCQAGTPVACDDGDACNGAETCDSALGCQTGTPLACDDGDPCTADSCDALSGCGQAAIQGCFAGAVPATPGWGLPLLAGLLLVAGALAMRLRRRAAA